MRRYPFTVPGIVRLTSGSGPSVIDRLRGAMEPLIMALIHRFDATASVSAVSSDELNTLSDEDYPREWWVRTSFVPSDAPDPAKARERAWLTIEYSRWEEGDEWSMQAFFRVADVEFSLGTDSQAEGPILNLVATRLPAGDIRMIEEVLRAHFGGPATAQSPGSMAHTIAL